MGRLKFSSANYFGRFLDDNKSGWKMSKSSDDRLFSGLKRYFGHSSFRSKEQESAVRALVKGSKDVFVSMPTGSGKSLIYQLPGVLAPSSQLTIVISPLLALM